MLQVVLADLLAVDEQPAPAAGGRLSGLVGGEFVAHLDLAGGEFLRGGQRVDLMPRKL